MHRIDRILLTALIISLLSALSARRVLYMPKLAPFHSLTNLPIDQEVFLMNNERSLILSKPTLKNLSLMYVSVGHNQSIFFHEREATLTFAYADPSDPTITLAPFLNSNVMYYRQESLSSESSPSEESDDSQPKVPIKRAVRRIIRLRPPIHRSERLRQMPGPQSTHDEIVSSDEEIVPQGSPKETKHTTKKALKQLPKEPNNNPKEEKHKEESQKHQLVNEEHLIESDSEIAENIVVLLKIHIFDKNEKTFYLKDNTGLCLSHHQKSFVMTKCLKNSKQQIFGLLQADHIYQTLEENQKKKAYKKQKYARFIPTHYPLIEEDSESYSLKKPRHTYYDEDDNETYSSVDFTISPLTSHKSKVTKKKSITDWLADLPKKKKTDTTKHDKKSIPDDTHAKNTASNIDVPIKPATFQEDPVIETLKKKPVHSTSSSAKPSEIKPVPDYKCQNQPDPLTKITYQNDLLSMNTLNVNNSSRPLNNQKQPFIPLFQGYDVNTQQISQKLQAHQTKDFPKTQTNQPEFLLQKLKNSLKAPQKKDYPQVT